MAWKQVFIDLGKTDQGTATYDVKTGAVSTQVTQTYVCESDGKTDMAAGAFLASAGSVSVPRAGAIDFFANVGPYYCTNVQPSRTGPYSYDVQVQWTWTYTPPQPGDPNDWNVTVRDSGSPYEQDAYQDKDKKPIVNSAGQSYDPTLKHTYNDEKITITWKSKNRASARFSGVRGKVNSGGCTLALPGYSQSFDTRTIRCDDAESSVSIPLGNGSATQASTPVFDCTATFTYRPDGFTDHVLDQGYYEVDDDGDLVQIKDKWGDPINAAVPLDGNGSQLDANGTPVFKDYKIEEEADFTSAFTF